MKKVLYTVCSANHLAHCKTMVQSFLHFNSDYSVYIGLADKVNGRFDIELFSPATILEVEKLGIEGFEKMANQYNVIELNCAMKVFVAQYIFKKVRPDILVYLDSDIWVHYSFQYFEKLLIQSDILITPHLISPLPDNEFLPLERDILRSGIFNAGFMVLKNTENVNQFLIWWASHMQDECYYQFGEGMGVDQIWINLLPLYFPKVNIITHLGANVAYWNLHERDISLKKEVVWVNEKVPLIFLHISGYQFEHPQVLSRHQTRFDLTQLPALYSLYLKYTELVKYNGYERFNNLPCFYNKTTSKSTGLMKLINQILHPSGFKISKL